MIAEGFHGWGTFQPNAAKVGLRAIHRRGISDCQLQTSRFKARSNPYCRPCKQRG